MSTPSKLRPPTKVIVNPFSSVSKLSKSSTSAINSTGDNSVKKRKLEKSPISKNSEPKKPISKNRTISKPLSKITSNSSIVRRVAKTANEMAATEEQENLQDGRLEDMEILTTQLKKKISGSEVHVSAIESELTLSQKRVLELENFRKGLETKVAAKEVENVSILNQFDDVKRDYEKRIRILEDEMYSAKRKYETEMETLNTSLENLKRRNDMMKADFDICVEENCKLKSTLANQSSLIITFESDKLSLNCKVESLQMVLVEKQTYINNLEADLQSNKNQIVLLESKLQDAENIRRKLHNEVQELKGNIRVFCRVRPLLDSELSDSMNHIYFPPESDCEVELIQRTESVSDNGKIVSKSYPFSFDKVFLPNSSQSQVFSEISQLVQSALDGYKVCIFAYGQTGSGKTFTMEGYNNTRSPNNVGMIPRAVQQIFQSCKALEEKGWKYKMEASFLEIYNETIRDLLGSSDKKHEIKHNAHTNSTFVTNLTLIDVFSPEEVFSLLEKATKNRAVAETKCNDRSSRSHSVFSLKLYGENHLTNEKLDGILNLIDLAGSERLAESGSTGERLKETQAINKSLSSLGDVIYSLANKDAHVPYRNSKLTYLLQNSLGGNSKTLMFVNISPVSTSFQETLCSLRFATKVNSCQIGTARKAIKE